MRWQYRNTVLLLCTLAFFVTMVARLAISPVIPTITTDFAVSNTSIGAALTGMWFAYALVQFPSGVLANRFGERFVILISIGSTGILSVFLVASPGFAVFLVFTVLIGAAAGLHYSVAATLLARTYTNYGTAIGLHNAGGPAAGLLTPIIVSWIGTNYGWRPAVAITAIIALPVAVLFAKEVHPTEPQRPDQPIRDQLKVRTILELLSRPPIVFTGVIAIVSEFTWQGLASFLPTFLIQHHGYSSTLAGVVFAAYFVVQGVLQVGVGSVADRYGRDLTIGLCTGSGISGLALLVTASGITTVSVGITLLGLSMGWGAAVLPRIMDHLSEAERSSGFGLVRTVYMFIASTGSVAVGLCADLFGWVVSFGMLIVLLTGVLVLVTTNWALGWGY